MTYTHERTEMVNLYMVGYRKNNKRMDLKADIQSLY